MRGVLLRITVSRISYLGFKPPAYLMKVPTVILFLTGLRQSELVDEHVRVCVVPTVIVNKRDEHKHTRKRKRLNYISRILLTHSRTHAHTYTN